jgi:hypothetical protein
VNCFASPSSSTDAACAGERLHPDCKLARRESAEPDRQAVENALRRSYSSDSLLDLRGSRAQRALVSAVPDAPASSLPPLPLDAYCGSGAQRQKSKEGLGLIATPATYHLAEVETRPRKRCRSTATRIPPRTSAGRSRLAATAMSSQSSQARSTADRFQGMLEEARRARAEGKPEEAAEELPRAPGPPARLRGRGRRSGDHGPCGSPPLGRNPVGLQARDQPTPPSTRGQPAGLPKGKRFAGRGDGNPVQPIAVGETCSDVGASCPGRSSFSQSAKRGCSAMPTCS